MSALRRRRLFQVAVLVAAIVGLVEVACLAAYRCMEGAFPDVDAVIRRQDEFSQRNPRGAPDREAWLHGLSQRSHSLLHPYVGFVVDREAWRRPDGSTEVEVSDWGFYDSASPIRPRDPKKIVVALCGGSVAAMTWFEAHATLERALEESRVFGERKVECVDLAIEGFKQPQQMLEVAWLLAAGAHFDVVVDLDGFNEVALHELENGRAGVHPTYPRDWPLFSAPAADAQVESARVHMTELRERRRQWARSFTACGPLRHLRSLLFLWRWGDRGLESQIASEQSKLRDTRRDHDLLTCGPPYDAVSRDALYDDLVAIWSRSSRELDTLCRAHGAKYFHFLQPNQYLPGSKPYSDEERELCLRDDSPYLAPVLAGYPRLIAAGRELAASGVAFHDLTRLFQEHGETLYSDDMCHLNARGSELLARAIAAAVADGCR
jgi:hypothetical protein